MSGQKRSDQVMELLRQMLKGPDANKILVGMVIAFALSLLIVCKFG